MEMRHIEVELNAAHGRQAVECLNIALQNLNTIEEVKDEKELDACINQQIGYVTCMAAADITNEQSRDNFIAMLNELGNKRLQQIKQGKKGKKWVR